MLFSRGPCYQRLCKKCKPAEVLEPKGDQGNVPELQSIATDPDALQLPIYKGPYLLCKHAKVLVGRIES